MYRFLTGVNDAGDKWEKTTYAPMIYTALCVNLLMQADPLLGQVVGVGPWKSRVFGPQMALAYRPDAISQGPKTLDFQGPTPSHLSA
jgi:hypothetical protein